MENIPCSVVFHLPKQHKYNHEAKGKSAFWVSDRVVESWFDDNYKKYYYRTLGDTKTRDYGDISANLEIKERLECKNFTWYVENVFPDIWIPEEIRDENWLKTTTENPTTILTTTIESATTEKSTNSATVAMATEAITTKT